MNSSYPPPSPCISPLPTPRSRGIKQGGLGLYTLPSTGLFQIPTGATHKERENLQRILQLNHLNASNDIPHQILSSYALGGNSAETIYDFSLDSLKPLPVTQPIEITSENFKSYLGESRLYPNFLRFFVREIATKNVVECLEKYLFQNHELFIHSFESSNEATLPLTIISLAVEFKLDALVAEGLARAATQTIPTSLSGLFDSNSLPPKPIKSPFFSAISSPFSSPFPKTKKVEVKFLTTDFTEESRTPNSGMSAFSIFVGAGAQKVNGLNGSNEEEIRRWANEWKFSTEEEDGVPGAPSWKECLEKFEELTFLATVIFSSTVVSGAEKPTLNQTFMKILSSLVSLPSLLEITSPDLRPFLLTAYLRVILGAWFSFGKPNLCIPPPVSSIGWLEIISIASRHSDPSLAGLIRSLAFCSTYFGIRSPGFYHSSLPGTESMDGSIFLSAAQITMKLFSNSKTAIWSSSANAAQTTRILSPLVIRKTSQEVINLQSGVESNFVPFVGDLRESATEWEARLVAEEEAEAERELMA